MPVSYIQIDIQKAKHNMKLLRESIPSNVKMMAVVKNDAYGNGAIKISQLATNNGFDYIGVARVSEALELINHGITVPIMILGLVPKQDLEIAIIHDCLIPIDTIAELQYTNKIATKYQKKAKVMIAVDTGLHRIGIKCTEIQPIIKEIQKLNYVYLNGIFTHFIEAESKNKVTTYKQLDRFNQVVNKLKDELGLLISASDSAAVEDIPEARFNLVRIGCLLAGIQPSTEILHPIPVEPILSIKSEVIHLEKVSAGESVGYGGTYIAKKDMYIATIPIGYGDGYRRCLSEKASVLIHGKKRKITGLICMDQMMVEADDTIQVGDEVVLVGKQEREEILAVSLAKMCDANVHEFLGGFRRLPKIYK